LALDSNCKLEFNKKAQMSAQMLTCIQNSISDKCALKLVASGEKFKLGINNSSKSLEVANGPLYHRMLITRITIDKSSTLAYIRKSLSKLDEYMISIDYNITKIIGLYD